MHPLQGIVCYLAKLFSGLPRLVESPLRVTPHSSQPQAALRKPKKASEVSRAAQSERKQARGREALSISTLQQVARPASGRKGAGRPSRQEAEHHRHLIKGRPRRAGRPQATPPRSARRPASRPGPDAALPSAGPPARAPAPARAAGPASRGQSSKRTPGPPDPRPQNSGPPRPRRRH